jgi:hypothetical protein
MDAMDAMVHSGSTWHASDVCRCDCHVAGRRAIAPGKVHGTRCTAATAHTPNLRRIAGGIL